jgi:hypothetical protein
MGYGLLASQLGQLETIVKTSPIRTLLFITLGTASLLGTGCTALIGGAVRHSKATAPSARTYSFAKPADDVERELVSLLAANGDVEDQQAEARHVIGTDHEKLYRYTATVRPDSAGSGALLDIRVEMIGDWENVGWHTTSDRMTSFVNELGNKVGADPVSFGKS